MALLMEQYLPPVQENGIQSAKDVTLSGSVSMSGSVSLTGSVTLGNKLIGSTNAMSGAGAVSLTSLVTKLTTTGANALTLADGTDGQVKIISMVADGGDGTLTPTTKTGYSTITFNDAGDGCILVFTTTTGWMIVSNYGCTVA